MKRIALILMLASPLFLLAACGSQESADKQQAQQESHAETQAAKQEATPSLAEQAQKKVEEAIQAYQEFARQHRDFLWRDTELHIAKAREALQKGEFDVALQEAELINKEVQLMKEQVVFAKNNWRKFMVNP
jgi:uncharacterized protein YcfL